MNGNDTARHNPRDRARTTRLPAALSLLMPIALAGACKTNAGIDPNFSPEANAGEDQQLPYEGEPVDVTLDGRASFDPDGEVRQYVWKAGQRETLEDGGLGALAGPDPDDQARPRVSLEEGSWTFVLWVADDRGHLSEPDTVVITVGESVAPTCDPADCEAPPLGVACCTSADTGAEPGDPRGRGPDLCGTDLGSVIASLAGTCLQLAQPGEPDDGCPEIMGASLEPGCCTDEGLCASTNTSAGLGCHYPQSGPGGDCSP